MNKAFLDCLYGHRARLIERKNELDSVGGFDGSLGSCHAEKHGVETRLAKEQLEMVDQLISDYLLMHGS